MAHSVNFASHVKGFCDAQFSEVRREFQRNFAQRGEQGAALAVYLHGRKVVDLWGGMQCCQKQNPWNDETLVLSFSVSKGMAAAALAVAHSRGLFALDAPVADYWPEFAVRGKSRITVRQLLSHQAGLIGFNRRVSLQDVGSPDHLAKLLADQRPAWQPGTRHGYHTLTLGWFQGELLRRIDPARRTLGRFFQEEIAAPLGVEYYIGLPNTVDASRLARVKGFHKAQLLTRIGELPAAMVLSAAWPKSLVAKSIRAMSISNPATLGQPGYRAVEVPSANGIGTAGAVAKIYSALCSHTGQLGLTERTRRELSDTPRLPSSGSRDAVLKMDTNYTFGFSRPSRDMAFGASDAAFGCPGAGGSFGMGDPATGLGYAYLTRKMGFRLFDDPREKAVRQACLQCVAGVSRTSYRAVA